MLRGILCIGLASVLSITVCPDSTVEANIRVTLECSVGKLRTPGNNVFFLPKAFIQNTSRVPIKVLTHIPSSGGNAQPETLVLRYELQWESDVNKRIIPSEVDLMPVTLLPGETARFELNIGNDHLKGYKYLQIEYVIAPEWGKRLKVWSGIAKSPIVSIPPLA